MTSDVVQKLGFYALALCAFAAVSGSYTFYMRRKWSQAARRLGLDYAEDDPARRMATWSAQLGYFSTVRGSFSHILRGSFEGRPVLVGEYGWKQGKSRAAHTVACFALSRPAPPFMLASEDLGDKIAAAFGAQDIDFEDDPAFSSAFVLKGEEQRVRPYFGPMLRHRLIDAAGWVVVGHGHELAVFKRARTISPDDLERFLRDTRRVADVFS